MTASPQSSAGQGWLNSVLGPVRADDIGLTLMHEHLLVGFPGWELQPDYRFDRVSALRRAVEALVRLRDHGVQSLVDPCPIELGRDAEFLAEASLKSGVTLFCATGFYTERIGLPGYWRLRSREEIAGFYLSEIENGIGTTGIRPAVIKCATGGQEVTPLERRFLEAAALASLQSGLPIMTHTENDAGGPEQWQVLAGMGVRPEACLIGHCSNSIDPGYHARIAGDGLYLGFDRLGMPRRHPDEAHARSILALVMSGHLDRLILGHDRYVEMLGGPARVLSGAERAAIGDFAHLFVSFLPFLKGFGLTEAQIDRMLRDNPCRFLRNGR